MKTIGLIDDKIVRDNLINLKNIVFEVTEKCNLKCKYCGLSERLYEKHDVREFRDLPFEKAKLMVVYRGLTIIRREHLVIASRFFGNTPVRLANVMKSSLHGCPLF